MEESILAPAMPETKHEIAVEIFSEIAKGVAFNPSEWCYGKTGKELKEDGVFNHLQLKDEQYYLILQETHCVSQNETALFLNELKGIHYKPAFIFTDCILPGIFLTRCITDDWIFIRTLVNCGMVVDDQSQVGYLRAEQGSQCEYLHINRSSKSKGLLIRENCLVSNIGADHESEYGSIHIASSQCALMKFDNKSKCGVISVEQNCEFGYLEVFNEGRVEDLMITANCKVKNIKVDSSGQCGNVSIYGKSRCGDISVMNGRIKSILTEGESQCGSINVSHNSSCETIKIRSNSEAGNIWIFDKSRVEDILVSENSKCGDIRISNNSQGGDIRVENGSGSGAIMLEDDSTAMSIGIYQNSYCQLIRLISNGISKRIDVFDNSLAEYIMIFSGSHVQDLYISHDAQCGNILIDQGKVNRIRIDDNCCSFFFRNADVSFMHLFRCNIDRLSWEAGAKVELYINSCTINCFQLISTSLLKDAVVSIINTQIYIIRLQGLIVQGQLIFRNIGIAQNVFIWQPQVRSHIEKHIPNRNDSKIIWDIYIAKGKLLQRQEEIYNTQTKALSNDPSLKDHIKPLFRIVNCSLGETEITGSDLTKFNFEYRDSKLLKVFFSGTQLPKERIDIYNGTPLGRLPDRVYFEQKISVYNQLKRIFENQGDVVEATWYHAKAMANQQRLLSLQYHEKADKWWSEEAFELFNFRLNKISNNHGESWRMALCFSFSVLLVIYTLYFTAINFEKPFALDGIDDFIGNFFSFLDITHKIDFMVEKEVLNGWAKFLDFFGRVATGYCIYQFIAAFRRHGKK